MKPSEALAKRIVEGLEAMETVTTATDNREKLAKSGAAERHLAIY